MRARSDSPEAIAHALHAARRELGVKYKNLTPPDVFERMSARNIKKYGDPFGPTIEWLRGTGKSWDNIIESAARPGGQDPWVLTVMGLVESHDKFQTIAEFNPDEGTLVEHTRSELAELLTTGKIICGRFARLHGTLVVPYRGRDRLELRIGAQSIPLSQGTVGEHGRTNDSCELRILDLGSELARVTYRCPRLDPPVSLDLTPFVEEEHFDFGLFIASVLNSGERQAQLLEQWSGDN